MFFLGGFFFLKGGEIDFAETHDTHEREGERLSCVCEKDVE